MVRWLFLILFIFNAAVDFGPVQDRDANAAIDTAAANSERSATEVGTFKRLSLVELIILLVAQYQQIQIQKAEWDFSSAYKWRTG